MVETDLKYELNDKIPVVNRDWKKSKYCLAT